MYDDIVKQGLNSALNRCQHHICLRMNSQGAADMRVSIGTRKLQITDVPVQDAASLQYVFGPARRKDGTWRYNLLELFILNGTEEKRAAISRSLLALLSTEVV